MKRIACIIALFSGTGLCAQTPYWPAEMAKTMMHTWKDSTAAGEVSTLPRKWTYDQGVVLKGIEGIWQHTGDASWFTYIQHSMDVLITKDGGINTYKPEDYNIDNINCGRILLLLYRVTGEQKYYKAAATLREQLKGQPRTNEGGFWHKKRYPHQMWLDGLYMASPFLAQYGGQFKEPALFDDVAKQIILMDRHGYDAATGLYWHAWDESHSQSWADPKTGFPPATASSCCRLRTGYSPPTPCSVPSTKPLTCFVGNLRARGAPFCKTAASLKNSTLLALRSEIPQLRRVRPV